MSVRRAIAHINLAAIERNAARMRAELRGGARLCAVVKADGYGHGAAEAASAALAGGASRLAVATAVEATQLRQAGLRGVPLLVMGALSDAERVEALAADADVCVWHEREVQAVAAAGGGRVHVKLDSGMGRLGTRDPAEASAVLDAAEQTEGVVLAGAMTHFATADDLDDGGFFEEQLRLFSRWALQAKAAFPDLLVHAANSAATLRSPAAHFDMVRCGISLYGIDPFGQDPLAVGLEPALELRSYVAEVKECRAGQSTGYGRRFVAERDTHVAVLPIGYGDGWRRGLSDNADVLIGGRRRPLVGTVSMDNSTVHLAAPAGMATEGAGEGTGASPLTPADGYGLEAEALLGCEAVLIGVQGEERITAEEVARRLGTIGYEITCGLTGRVPRIHHFDGCRDRAGAGAEHHQAVGETP